MCGWIMPLFRQGRGDLGIQRFLETAQAILAQIATFLQQCDTQSTNLDDLENTRRGSYSMEYPMEYLKWIPLENHFLPK